MTDVILSTTPIAQLGRRRFLTASLAGAIDLSASLAVGRQLPRRATPGANKGATVAGAARSRAVRPFRFGASTQPLDDLRLRIRHTKWLERVTVNGATQGMNIAKIRKQAEYWENRHDWRHGGGREASATTLRTLKTRNELTKHEDFGEELLP